MTENLGDLDNDLPLKVKCDSAIGLSIYGFLLMFNGNIGPNLGYFSSYKALESESPWNWPLKATIQGHSRSDLIVAFE